MLVKYVRGKHGKFCGAVVADYDADCRLIKLGWSAVHPKDTFDKELAKRIAYGRATVNRVQNFDDIPKHIVPELRAMYTRASRYFK